MADTRVHVDQVGADFADSSPRWVSVQFAAGRYQVSELTIRRLIKAEKLPAVNLDGGRCVRIDLGVLDELFRPV